MKERSNGPSHRRRYSKEMKEQMRREYDKCATGEDKKALAAKVSVDIHRLYNMYTMLQTKQNAKDSVPTKTRGLA